GQCQQHDQRDPRNPMNDFHQPPKTSASVETQLARSLPPRFEHPEKSANPVSVSGTQTNVTINSPQWESVSRKTFYFEISYLRKWFLMASAWPRVTTAARAEASACLTACKLPKCSSNLRVVLAPTPGISSNSLERSRICRRLRWKVTAKRWASS